MEESKTVYRRCREGFFKGGKTGGVGKAPLEDQRHSPLRPEGNKIQCSGRKTRPEQSLKHTLTKKKLLKICRYIPIRNQPLTFQTFDCLYPTVWDRPFSQADIKQIQLRENNGGRDEPIESRRKRFMYNKHSHRK